MADHLVKLIHARDLAGLNRFPAYEDHEGLSLAEHRRQVEAREELRREISDLVYAQEVVRTAEVPVTYRTKRVHTPWPLSLPLWRSVRLRDTDHPGTTFRSHFGEIRGDRLVAPLLIKEQPVYVEYMAPVRLVSPKRIAKAQARLDSASGAELEGLAQYNGLPEPDPILFISHRWKDRQHPDPEGAQLTKLQALRDCYLIYDYASFPQDTSSPESAAALAQVLDEMNDFIDNVMVLDDPEYMTRGWCIYEYIHGALTHRIVCDEIADPRLKRLQSAVATEVVATGMMSTSREARNAKNQFILEAVNAVLPAFASSAFTVPEDRKIVRDLLIAKLKQALPPKQEYIPYVSEWKTEGWTEDELAAAFLSKLEWEPLQYDPRTPVFEPKVPSSVEEAVAGGYSIETQPKTFGLDKYSWSMHGWHRWAALVGIGVLALLGLIAWGSLSLVRWVVGV